jgi:hypothetical protein
MSSLVPPNARPFDGSVGVSEKMLTAAKQIYKQSSLFYIRLDRRRRDYWFKGLFCCDREAIVF